MEYNTGNIDKYMSKNPLKRRMIFKLNVKILHIVKDAYDSRLTNEKVTILDAGCGEGFISNLIYSNLGGVDITGLEYTEEALRIARERVPEVSFIQGDIMQMPFGNSSFDIVLCTEVLEHLPNPEGALRELLRVTGKTLIITVPNEPWFCMGNFIVLKNVKRFGNPIDHINHWTYFGFSRFLSSHSKEEWHMDKSFPWTIARCDVNEGDC